MDVPVGTGPALVCDEGYTFPNGEIAWAITCNKAFYPDTDEIVLKWIPQLEGECKLHFAY